MKDDDYWRGQIEKKRRFQFHLATAIITMFVASGLLWANLSPFDTPIFFNGQRVGVVHTYGWPFSIRPTVFGNSTVLDPDPFAITANVAIGIFILFIVAKVSEVFMRRRDQKRSASD